MLLASLYEPPVTSIEVPVLSHDRDLQPSIFNLTRTIPMDLLPILAASRSTVITGSTPDEVPLAANVMMGSQQNGFRIEFRNK